MRPKCDHKTTRIFSTVPEILIDLYKENTKHVHFGIEIEHAPEYSTNLRRRMSIEAQQRHTNIIYVQSFAEFASVLATLQIANSVGLLNRALTAWTTTNITGHNLSLIEYIEKTIRWIEPLRISREAFYLPKHNVFRLEFTWDDRSATDFVYISARKETENLLNFAYDFRADEIPAFDGSKSVKVELGICAGYATVDGIGNGREVYPIDGTNGFGFIVGRCLEGD